MESRCIALQIIRLLYKLMISSWRILRILEETDQVIYDNMPPLTGRIELSRLRRISLFYQKHPSNLSAFFSSYSGLLVLFLFRVAGGQKQIQLSVGGDLSTFGQVTAPSRGLSGINETNMHAHTPSCGDFRTSNQADNTAALLDHGKEQDCLERIYKSSKKFKAYREKPGFEPWPDGSEAETHE